MSANPTEYDLVQDARITDVESSIKTSYEPPSAVEFSYPVVDQPMNDEQWQYVTLGFGDGVLDEGGQPYWLRGRENVNNTLSITTSTTTKTAQAILRGFYHKMIADKSFTVPPVSTTTTYHFCLTYDPVGSKRAGGPISLQMYAGTPPTTLGRFHILLWTLERKPNQLLTDCTVQRVRPKITPTISVNREADRPDPSKVLWGTRVYCHDTGVEYYATGASEDAGGPTAWSEVGVVRGWTPIGLNSAFRTYQTNAPRYRIADGQIWLRGAVEKTTGSISTSGPETFGWAAGVNLAPWRRLIGAGGGNSVMHVETGAGATIYDNLTVKSLSSNITWFSLEGLHFPL